MKTQATITYDPSNLSDVKATLEVLARHLKVATYIAHEERCESLDDTKYEVSWFLTRVFQDFIPTKNNISVMADALC